MPPARTLLPFARSFSREEYLEMAEGFLPAQMEDKWFIYCEDNTFYFHRSWTGHCIFTMELEQTPEGYRPAAVFANRDPNQYTQEDESRDCVTLNCLIDGCLLEKTPQSLSFPATGAAGDVNGFAAILHTFGRIAMPEFGSMAVASAEDIQSEEDAIKIEWDKLIPQMVRQMIRHPAEWLTFEALARLIPASDADALHALAETHPNLFFLAKDRRAAKLHLETVRSITQHGLDWTVENPPPTDTQSRRVTQSAHCDHFSDEALLNNLRYSTPADEALVRGCCWSQICRVYSSHRNLIPSENWQEICRIRGYMLARQNARGF
jgi:hypothetical protein